MKAVRYSAMLGIACLIVLANAVAQEADSLKEIRRRIDILTEEIERLKLGEVAEQHYESRGGLGPAAGRVYQLGKTGASIAGYGEVVYENYSADRDDHNPSGKADQVDFLRNVLYVGYRFSDWILFNSEIEFEHAGEEVSVEFGYVELMVSRALNVRVGMVLPPVGIVNEKHEPSTFFGTLRPFVERSVIPATWRTNGLGVIGDLGPWSYRAYIVEGLDARNFSDSDGIRGGRQKGAEARAEDLAFTGRLEYDGLAGSVLGGSLYVGNSGQGQKDSLGTIKALTTLWSFHAEFAWKGLEARALYASVSVDDAGRVSVLANKTVGSSMNGWYVVAGYDLMPVLMPGSNHSLAPFVQYERLNTQAAVASGFIANKANDRSVLTVGITYKPHPSVAFKVDYRDNRNEAGTAIDQWNMAVNYFF